MDSSPSLIASKAARAHWASLICNHFILFPCCTDTGEFFSPMRGSEGEAGVKGSLICAITMGERAECKVCIQTLTSSDSWKECPVTQAGEIK